ncbi:hypothetical protein [Oceanobacillus damuensis]|uniref:hypothetical protein n=1 Tax=Oceanobacillus damuensis TaxID=937928 RepID=UPI000A0108FB|nr:hypothetical protein [Oceanobacillus damuensis]
MGDIIFTSYFVIVIYVVLILSYFYPRESILFGKRWMYEEDPEPSEEAIRFARLGAVAGIVIVTIIVLASVFYE